MTSRIQVHDEVQGVDEASVKDATARTIRAVSALDDKFTQVLVWGLSTTILLGGLYYFAFRYNYFFYPRTLVLTLLAVVAAAICFAAIRLYSFDQRRVEAISSIELEAMESDSLAIKNLVRGLRRRARTLKNAARFTLFLTFLSIASGLYIFTTAGQIASRDSYASALADDLRLNNAKDQFTGERVEYWLGEYKRAQVEPSITVRSDIETEIRTAAREMNERSKRNEQIITRIDQATSSRDTLFFFLSTLSTRIGSVLLLIFLVQILLSVYRYSIRLETYYESRADALLIYRGSSEEQLQQLISALSPEKIGFGKTPVTPTEHAVEVVKGIASVRK